MCLESITKKIRVVVVVIAALICFSQACIWAETSEKPLKILFIGNSFTLGSGHRETVAAGGIPGLVEQLAEAAGFPTPVVYILAHGGFSLGQHLRNVEHIETALQGRDWDYVVLQEFSTLPTTPGDGERGGIAEFMKSLAQFRSMIEEFAPNSQILLFQTWAREQDHNFYHGSSPRFPGGPKEMNTMLRENYAAGAAMIGARVISVGDAWELCREHLPQLYLHSRDQYHAGARGSYLTGLIFFTEVYDRDPRVLPALNGVPEVQAKQLQELVWKLLEKSQQVTSID